MNTMLDKQEELELLEATERMYPNKYTRKVIREIKREIAQEKKKI